MDPLVPQDNETEEDVLFMLTANMIYDMEEAIDKMKAELQGKSDKPLAVAVPEAHLRSIFLAYRLALGRITDHKLMNVDVAADILAARSLNAREVEGHG